MSIPSLQGRQRPRVLVCDADDVSARLMTRVLANGGYDVSTTSTGREAQLALVDRPSDVFVLALLLPDIDGLSLVRELRAQGITVPIVVVSSLRAEQRALVAGANMFLPKPVVAGSLLNTVRGFLPQEGL